MIRRNLFFVMTVLAILACGFSSSGQDGFREWKEDEIPGQDELKTYTDSNFQDKQQDTGNAQAINPENTIGSLVNKNESGVETGHKHDPMNMYWVLGIMGLTVAAGFLSRSATGRHLRLFFLIASVAIIGFYRSACPCPVSGFQEVLLFGFGGPLHPIRLLWFALLIPVTYFFGRIWCGWVCHLGALQELVNFNGRFNLLSSPRAQSIMRYARIIILVVLIVQLVVTRTILWDEIDPFKAIFNLFASQSFTWILVVLLLISSVLVYRPFCKTICPVGLVLGWISKIPGASIIAAKPNCAGCKLCSSACRSNAITKTGQTVYYDKEKCISCGECIDSCKHKALGFGTNRCIASNEKFVMKA